MTDDEKLVCLVEPSANEARLEDGTWLVRRSPFGVVFGRGPTRAKAWHSARMNLFAGSIVSVLSDIPVVEK
ncbi:MAG TPA: hypothetical protein VMQ76_00290 [Terracidiphilus sp.]|jgi:hypothetical protein|nr:hypothetical protein [Terracidiphilus sp.]